MFFANLLKSGPSDRDFHMLAILLILSTWLMRKKKKIPQLFFPVFLSLQATHNSQAGIMLWLPCRESPGAACGNICLRPQHQPPSTSCFTMPDGVHGLWPAGTGNGSELEKGNVKEVNSMHRQYRKPSTSKWHWT